ncbi:N-acetylmuramoyl-L-alanine amidase [Acerihabitans arboris]|uniref:N-acetylmuramoyl-L-alanine amidase n=1 Tax=Acerihabitans arboris TaxID=2691583 RepID=A0A845SHN2_9GAMM|nr:N-acetylmuramoyl-L-alanine amidase [Acerihabitans arboris]NDL62892.1 N-acetylmuramoyl-L-alanine amidase [Acerihabitans arboris]
MGLLCVSCAGRQAVKPPDAQAAYRIDSSRRASGADERVQFLVIHYTAEDFASSLTTLTAEQVSAHYLIPAQSADGREMPTALQLVDESRRAWHAGESFWRGRTHLNDTSVGIEIENQGYYRTLTGYRATPYPSGQIALVIALSRDIIRRYHLQPGNVVGHSDIAWRRKQDPGPLFPWQQLAAAGVGVWPDKQRVGYYLGGRDPCSPVAMAGIMTRMADYGYDVSPQMPAALQQKALAAFQMHFRPHDFRGLADAETEAILDALLEIHAGERGAG